MEVTERPRRTGAARRVRASEEDRGNDEGRDGQYDLLTAALLGVAVGAAAAMLLSRGPSGEHRVRPIARHARKGAQWAGVHGAAGARWVRDRGEELWDRVPRDEIRERLRDYVDTAAETITEVVDAELKDLRKSIRRQRRRIGI